MRVLLTGGSGFIGGALNAALNAAGFDVLALARSSAAAIELKAAGSKVFLGSITDRDAVLKAASDVDAVFHLAGVVSHHRADAKQMTEVNIGGTENIIAALKNTKKRLIHISSVATVGALPAPGSPLDETATYNLSPLALPYFETKRGAELRVLSEVKAGALDAVVINPSTVFGPRDGLKGSRRAHVKAANGKLLACPVGGVSIASIAEVCDAIIYSLQHGRSGERYILGGDNISIAEMFMIVAQANEASPPLFSIPTPVLMTLGYLCSPLELLGIKAPINVTAVRTATLFHWYSSEKAKRELNYQPLPASQSLVESARWIRRHMTAL